MSRQCVHKIEEDSVMPKTQVKQLYDLSCGAACLLCAGIELNATPLAGGGDKWDFFVREGTGLDDARGQWQQLIYANCKANSGYSMPSGVLQTANLLGMNASVILSGTNTAGALKWKYPEEIKKCLANIEKAHDTKTVHLGPNERLMHCMRMAGAALHWVLQRDDNSYMDPADGSDHTDRNALKKSGQTATLWKTKVGFEYHGTGLAVRLWC
jgi:hypothetical protein